MHLPLVRRIRTQCIKVFVTGGTGVFCDSLSMFIGPVPAEGVVNLASAGKHRASCRLVRPEETILISGQTGFGEEMSITEIKLRTLSGALASC